MYIFFFFFEWVARDDESNNYMKRFFSGTYKSELSMNNENGCKFAFYEALSNPQTHDHIPAANKKLEKDFNIILESIMGYHEIFYGINTGATSGSQERKSKIKKENLTVPARKCSSMIFFHFHSSESL